MFDQFLLLYVNTLKQFYDLLTLIVCSISTGKSRRSSLMLLESSHDCCAEKESIAVRR